MQFKGRDIITTTDLSRAELEYILKIAKSMEPFASKNEASDLLKGKVMASLFYEPSTRTRLSFETAMLRLGGNVITTVGIDNSSLFKGETIADTAKVIELYSDVIVVRHPKEGTAKEMASNASVPVINAGDGSAEHPTQALLDLYTIHNKFGKIDGLKIALSGDLKHSRSLHSLCDLLSHFKVECFLVSPNELKMPENILEKMRSVGVKFVETEDFEGVIKGGVDVFYCNRIQKERFKDELEYERLKYVFVLNKEKVLAGKRAMIVMNPLPRVGEILEEVDSLENAYYFTQAKNGVAIRMALLCLVLGKIN